MSVTVIALGTIKDKRVYKPGESYLCRETEAARLIALGVAEAAPVDPTVKVDEQGGAEPPAAPPAPPPPAPVVVKSTSFRNPLRKGR